MGRTFTKECLEQRIAAFTSFVQEQGWVLIYLGIGDYRASHFLVNEQDHLVEVAFGRQGGIRLSVEAGSSPEHWIRPRLISWIEQERPRFEGKKIGYSFSDLACPLLTTPAFATSAQAQQGEFAETRFPDSDDAEEKTGGVADQQWIAEQFAVYTPREDFPSNGSATVPRWVTTPSPTTLYGRTGTIVTMEFVFDASQQRLREQFALHVQQLVAQEGSVLLNTITFSRSTPVLHQSENMGKATDRYLTVIHLLLFQPHPS